MQEDQMKFFLLTIGVLLFIPAFAAAQFSYQLNSFDALPDTGAGYGWYDDGGANTHLIRTIDTDNKYEGSGAMRVDWQNQCYDQYGGWIGLNYFDPDSGFIEDFGLYDSLSFWIYNEQAQSSVNKVELRFIVYDHGPGTAWDEWEVWLSHHLVLNDGPGWQEIKFPLIDVGSDAQNQHIGPGLWNPGWGQTAEGNGELDLDQISGWAFEWSQDASLYQQPMDSVWGVILFDDLELVGVKKVDLIFFNGKSVPGTVDMHVGWSGTVGVTDEESSDEGTNSIKWSGGAAWDAVNFSLAKPRNMLMNWHTDSLQFKIKAQAGIGDLTLNFWDVDHDPDGKEDYAFTASYTLTEASVGYDGTWKQVKVALHDFNRFAGVWDNDLNASVAGEFDSTEVASFSIGNMGQVIASDVYFDDVWTGTPTFDFNPPAQVTGVTSAPGDYYNLVYWDDLASESDESYSVYASTSPITDINDPSVEVVATNVLPSLGLNATHWLYYPLQDKNVTYYYAVTCTDAAGNVGPAGLSDAVTNVGKGVPTISMNVPGTFTADGDLTEWDASGIMPWELTATTSNIAAGAFDNNDDDLSATVWVAIDDNNLYVACNVTDNDFVYDPATVNSPGWWTQDAFEFYIGLWDQNGKPIHDTGPANSRGVEPDYKLIFLEDGYRNEYKSWVDPFAAEFNNDDANYHFEALGSRDYVIEASIPLDSIRFGTDARFHPQNGMRIMFDLVFHDNDADLGDQGGGNLTWSLNNTDLAYLDQHEWTSTWIGDTTHVATSINRKDDNLVRSFELRQNYPNPFNPVTTIEYAIATPGRVQVEIFNLLGERVVTLVDQNQNTGTYRVEFDGANLSSGVYFYSIRANGFFKTKKMILLK